MIQTGNSWEPTGTDRGSSYPHWLNGFGGYHTYIRDTPDRFEGDADDRLMWSLYNNFAHEGRDGGKPNGHFWLDSKGAHDVSVEVVRTHLQKS